MDWENLLRQEFYKVPGEHGLVIGSTGTGKTQMLYYLVNAMKTHALDEKIVWFDCGKTGEILQLGLFGQVTVHSPDGCKVEIIPRLPELSIPGQFEFKHFAHPMELWDNLDSGRINVISIEAFFPDPKHYSREITEAFKTFILKARAHVFEDAGLIPMTIFIDELQWLIPSERNALCREHNEGAKWMQRNLELLRSMQIRVIGATQGWGKLRPGARDSFGWLFLKRGSRFGSYDRPKLAERNKLWQSLCDACYVVVRPDMVYADVIYKSQFYGNTRKKGMVRYHGDGGVISPAIPVKDEV